MEYAKLNLPLELADFLALLQQSKPTWKPRVMPGGKTLGNWWVDLPARKKITIEWRPGRGFGLWVGSTAGFGEGPTELFLKPQLLLNRVLQLQRSSSMDRSHNGLKTIRELYGVSQDQIAARLKIKQAAISRAEQRADMRIETVVSFVEALGGTVEFRAIFPDSQLPIYWDTQLRHHPNGTSHAKIKSRSFARA